jgi:iron complex outermembrane receptor protein
MYAAIVGAVVAARIAVWPPAAAGVARPQEPAAIIRLHVFHAPGDRDTVPVERASVRAGRVSRFTDARGRAELRVPRGEHRIAVSRIGFAPETLLVAVAAGADTTIRVALEPRSTELEPVIVTATRSGRRIEDEPVRVEVLGPDEVNEKLDMTPGDITMMMNETPGLRVQTTSPSLGGANVRVQGLRGRYTQILSDGLPLFGAQTGGLGLLQIPPMDLGGVEIVKGVASALYGGSALGGVINLLSRRPGPDPVREILINQTSLGGTDAVGFDGRQLSSDWGYTLLAGAHRQSQLDRDADGWTDLPGYARGVLRPRVFWSSPLGHTIALTAGATLEEREGGTMTGRVAPGGSPHPEALRTARLDAGGAGRFLLGSSGTVVSARGSLALQRHRHRFGPTLERDQHLTWFGETALSATRGRTSWVLGGALEQVTYEAEDVAGFDYTFTTPGVFAQGTVDLVPWLAASGSARLDSHSRYGTFVSPRLSVLVRLGAGWITRASAGTGFFAPTPFTEETEVIGLAPLAPVTGLSAERARTASLDLGGALGAVQVNATFFGSVVRAPVGLRPLNDGRGGVELVNVAEPARTAGTELFLGWSRGPVRLVGTYTYVHSSEADPEDGTRRTVPLTPAHQAGLVAVHEEEGSGRVGLEVYYTGAQQLDDNPYRVSSKPYVHIGLMAERRLGPVRAFVNAENLLDVRQTRYHPLVLPSVGPGGRWTTDVWAPLDGRVANLGVRIDLLR